MRSKRPVPTRTCLAVAALVSAAATVAVLAPAASAAPSALPLPLPAAGAESLVTEGVTIEGPLVNNLNLPTLK
ncbi:hypothetical protein EJ357_20520 [Streptomyces cyaneochromogenes]|uniref:Secreted protein n=1 Tax=Streptomyces cyaneochromogenes TaxID=2496836 RepID=A0A3S9M8U6_9ACTN|nr:hypothetical protein [Streptomyces cyaneochromogenes]AZQ35592.1 hypothetical protein EJ357_20520 [Streptomyces cyaneochromogenes]